jgi:hemolysin activation/secretion protein
LDLEKKFKTATSRIQAAGGAAPSHQVGLAVFVESFHSAFSRIVATVVFAAIGATAVAQQPPRPDAGSVLEGTKPPVVVPRPAPEVLPRRAEPRPALGAPGLKVVVTRFRISGNTLFGEDILAATIREFVGKEQNIDGLNDAATKVRAYYRERGYFLTQAYLPQQEIKDGVIEVAVIEARLGKVELGFKEGTRFSEGIVRGIIEKHLKEGDLITETGLETPLLMLNDFPNAVVSSEIRPSKTIGAADIRINISDSGGFINGNVSMDNAGNRFTGAIRTSLNMNVNNPLSLGDQLSANAMRTDEPMGLYRLGYVVPVGHWGTRVGVSYTAFHYQLGKNFVDLRAHGVGTIVGVAAFHPLVRTRGANVILQFSYDDKTLNDRIESTATNDYRSITASHLGAVGDLRDGLLGGGLNSFGATITEGSARIQTPGALATDQAATGRKTHGRFAKYNYEFRRLQKITDNASLLLALQGQIGSRNLMSAEKFSLGGSNGIRAYPTGEALGDSGHLLQAEFRYLVPGFKLASGDITVSGFWDQGWVRLNQDQLPTDAANERRLSGYGFGASIGKDTDFLIRASAAWRNETERPVSDTATRIPRVWVQGIKWF